MKAIIISILLVVPAVLSAGEPKKEKPPVAEAIKAIKQCTSWDAEDTDPTPERSKQIEKGSARDCAKAQKAATKALKAHPDDPALAWAVLELNDAGYYSLSSTDENRLCIASLTLFEQQYAKSHARDSQFNCRCPMQAKKLYSRPAKKS